MTSQNVEISLTSSVPEGNLAMDIHSRLLHISAPAMVQSIDSAGRLVHVSDNWLRTLGYEREEVVGQQFSKFLSPRSGVQSASVVIPALFERGYGKSVEYGMLRKDGSLIDVLVSAVVDLNPVRMQQRSLTIIQDITERTRLQKKLLAQKRQLEVTLHSIADGVISTDASGRISYMNPAAEMLTSCTLKEARGKFTHMVFKLICTTNRQIKKNPVDSCLERSAPFFSEQPLILIGSGELEHVVNASASLLKSADGETTGVVLVLYDVSEQHRLVAEMKYRASHDSLTGLLNRDEFEVQLMKAIGATDLELDRAVMFIDLDQFKIVNDSAGHSAGDQLLRHIAAVIKSCVKINDVVARIGGDEFGVIFEVSIAKPAMHVARQICRQIDHFRFRANNQTFHVGASVGVVASTAHWASASELLRAADTACYAAKQAGRNRVHQYADSDAAIAQRYSDMHWIRCIENAIDTDGFVLYWQRIKPLEASSDGVHVEILIRMRHEDGSHLSPMLFLPVSERYNLAQRIDKWVLQKLLSWIAQHEAELEHVSTLAVNLSGLSLGDAQFHDDASQLLGASGIKLSKLCFEVTETAAITNMHQANIFFAAMRVFGVRFALDDFGSGVSSFGYLKNLPVDYLKIDGQFIKDLDSDKVDQATVRCIQEIAELTGKQTIAEFVETECVEAILREFGVDFVQGYLYHEPEILDTLLALQEPVSKP